MEVSGAKKIRISSATKKLPEEATKELPEELIRVEILARLPVKSFARFKSVCKSWLSLLSSDPQFIKELYRHNYIDHDCIVADKLDHIDILSRYEERFSLRGDRPYYLIGSANGLVCVGRGNKVFLWNPTIYQSKEFEFEFDVSPLYYFIDKIGFGFDPVSNDYKVVVCYQSLPRLNLNYVVYSSNSGTWIDQQHNPGYKILMSKFKEPLTPTTMVKDCPYWTCSTRDQNKTSLSALKFDATSNEFKLLAEFFCDVSSERKKTFKFVNMRDLLALMVCEPCPTSKLDVYYLDEEKGCSGVWSKMYSFGPFEQFWSFEHLHQGFKYGEEIVFYEHGKIYNHKTKTFECLPGPTPFPSPFKSCFTYTPSLIFLPGMTSIYSNNQTTALGHQYSTTPTRLTDSLRNNPVD